MRKIDKRSISDRLAALGYSHRRNSSTINSGKREVYIIATGEIVGSLDAHEAVQFLAKQGA